MFFPPVPPNRCPVTLLVGSHSISLTTISSSRSDLPDDGFFLFPREPDSLLERIPCFSLLDLERVPMRKLLADGQGN